MTQEATKPGVVAVGNVTTYKIGDAVKRLNDVKTGDQVVLRVTDAPAILVEKP